MRIDTSDFRSLFDMSRLSLYSFCSVGGSRFANVFGTQSEVLYENFQNIRLSDRLS